jgi:hypothetical protein
MLAYPSFEGENKECRENFEKFEKFESSCNILGEKENKCREEKEFGFYKLGGQSGAWHPHQALFCPSIFFGQLFNCPFVI